MSTVLAQRSMLDKIESKLNIDVARGIKLRPGRGLEISSLEDAFEVSKVLAIADAAVPKHLREKPGLCLNVCLMAYSLNMDPFALANKTYVVNDRLCFEAALYHAVVLQRAPIAGRIKSSYDGEGPKRTCRVWAKLSDDDDVVEYVSPPTGNIKPKNSPLWTNDPDQQLFYFSVRSFARRHFPDVMMGIYTVDEMQDSSEVLTQIQAAPSVQLLAGRLTNPTIAKPEETPNTKPEPESDETLPVVDPPTQTQEQSGENLQATVELNDVDPPSQYNEERFPKYLDQIEEATDQRTLRRINSAAIKSSQTGEIYPDEYTKIQGHLQERKNQLPAE